MFKIICHKYLSALILLAWLFSANAFFFGSHAAAEALIISDPSGSESIGLAAASSNHHHSASDFHHGHADPGTAHDNSHTEEDCCSNHGHSHDLMWPLPTALFLPASTSPSFFELTAYIPEVFLDRFIPPQNLS